MAPFLEPCPTEADRSYRLDREHIAKRRKTCIPKEQGSASAQEERHHETKGVPPHPLNIKPLGNAYDGVSLKASCRILARLPDELLLQLLEYLGAQDLVNVGSTCKMLYAFSRTEELWRSLFIESPPSNFKWCGTWRSTYLSIPSERTGRISCAGLYSDVLYRPFFCAHTPLRQYTANIPPRNQIPRLPNLTSQEFNSHWANKPFILTAPVQEWPVYMSWSIDNLLGRYRETLFRAEAVDWPLQHYVSYMNDSNDENPLYLFDCRFVEKMALVVGRENENADYWIPDCFGEDLFSVLGDMRPDSRWLIVGPERSGSTFHKDPNATSAWNAVLRGAKYWIIFPSSPTIPPPPGVFVSDDQSEVTSPLSIAEWLLGFHEEARKTPGCLEGICNAGEVLHVPSGWFHLVLNTKPSIAITQNFIPRAHLPAAITFLRDHPGNISGFGPGVDNPAAAFLENMEKAHPELLQDAMQKLAPKTTRKGAWEMLTTTDRDTSDGKFGFGFGFAPSDGEDDDIR